MRKLKYPEVAGEMAKHGETLKDVGKLIGVTYSSVSRKISGENPWTIGEIEILANTITKIIMNYLKKQKKKNRREWWTMMYSKIDLIENKKMEKILRENKYRMRDLDRKRARKEKIETIISCILFSLVMLQH